MSTERECVICYDPINASANVCITPCGHEFCFNCMLKHLQQNNGCPCCRATLIEEPADEEDEEDEDGEYEDDDEDDEDDDEEDPENEYPIEDLVSAFENKGYGLKDALSLLMYKFSKTDEKYTKAYIRQLEADIDDMNEELQNERAEQIDMAEEDANVAV